jgi:hypothetical protein
LVLQDGRQRFLTITCPHCAKLRVEKGYDGSRKRRRPGGHARAAAKTQPGYRTHRHPVADRPPRYVSRNEKHVVEANTHSKAVLRVAAEEFVSRNQGVHYFPSYELVTNGIERPWDADQRHVTPATVSRVMEMFHEMYVAS